MIIYLSVMFLVREVYFSRIGFIANGLLWSFATLAIATWRMRARGVSWTELGLRVPDNYKVSLIATVSVLVLAIVSIVLFQVMQDHLALGLAADDSGEIAVAKFGDLQGNWTLLLAILPFVWLESLLEEVLDRGFLMNWIERTLSNTRLATVVAVKAGR